MKKFGLILFLFSMVISLNAKADICYDITPEVSAKAVKILEKQKEIWDYCSICETATPQQILIKEVKIGIPLFVNGNPIDLAHTYYKENDKFINLGIATNCIKNNEYNIAAELNNLPNINNEGRDYRKEAKNQAQEIFKTCLNENMNNEIVTTNKNIEQNQRINNCLSTAIETEIKKGFATDEQQKMLNYLQILRKNIFDFYYGIYAENKYCFGACGSITALLPFTNEYDLLIDMLENLLYLNLTKNGY